LASRPSVLANHLASPQQTI